MLIGEWSRSGMALPTLPTLPSLFMQGCKIKVFFSIGENIIYEGAVLNLAGEAGNAGRPGFRDINGSFGFRKKDRMASDFVMDCQW